MEMFISKLQYDYFEHGEFVQIEECDTEAVLKKFDNFDWDSYTNILTLSLTCPSITIEHHNGSYLKIGRYHYGEYVLYFLNPLKKLFHKIVETKEDARQILLSYLDGSFQPGFFMKYWEIQLRPERFFKTKEFVYRVNWMRCIWMLLYPMIFFMMFVGMITVTFDAPRIDIFFLCFSIVFFIFMGGISFYLFFEYYFFSKNLVLILSRGDDEFYFGDKDDLKKYNKGDIKRIVDWGHHGKLATRGPIWLNFHVFQFEMKNSEKLKFTSLMMSDIHLSEKLGWRIKNIHRFIPTLKSTNRA